MSEGSRKPVERKTPLAVIIIGCLLVGAASLWVFMWLGSIFIQFVAEAP